MNGFPALSVEEDFCESGNAEKKERKYKHTGKEPMKRRVDRKSTRLNSSHSAKSRMPSSA